MKLGQTRKYKLTGSQTLWSRDSAQTILQQQSGPPVTCQQGPETLVRPPGFNHNFTVSLVNQSVKKIRKVL